MHDLKLIRKNPDFFTKKISERNVKFDLNTLLNLDNKNRKLIQEKEKLEQEKKKISQKKDETLFKKSKEISLEIDKLNKNQFDIKKAIDNLLNSLPNIALDDVPIGEDAKSNKEINKTGTEPQFDFTPLSHDELGKKIGQMDFDSASKTSGARFVFLKDQLALLERAISNFMLDVHTQKFGYKEISPPLIVNEDTMFGTGQLPKFESDQFEIKLDDPSSRKFLIPTAEVILTNLVKDSFLNENDLPQRYVASTPCFRKEAGSYGKDTKGMIRQHQFYKVELVSIVEYKNSKDELNRMLNCAETILKKLDLPYRVILLSTGDMGFSAEKTFDLEVWIPSENKYREISSCSSCGQFQARRMRAKLKNKSKETDFLATLNGSGLAIGRTLIAIMENYQQKDGSIIIPDVLVPYMNNKKQIG
jgi:seryl-tRNA synthetase